MKRKLWAGQTGEAIPIFVYDSTKSDGSGLGGLAYNTSGLVAEYRRCRDATWTPITLATMTLGTWFTGGFVADGSLTGVYELGIPNAALASAVGVHWVLIRLRGAANMVPVQVEIELDGINYPSGGVNVDRVAGVTAATYYAALTDSSTTTVVQFASLDALNNAIADDGGLAGNIYQVVGATNAGKMIVLGAATVAPRSYNVVNGPLPFTPDHTTQLAPIGVSLKTQLAMPLNSPRALDAVADAGLTLNDALHGAIATSAGREAIAGTNFTVQTPAGTTIRTFTLNSSTAPTTRT